MHVLCRCDIACVVTEIYRIWEFATWKLVGQAAIVCASVYTYAGSPVSNCIEFVYLLLLASGFGNGGGSDSLL